MNYNIIGSRDSSYESLSSSELQVKVGLAISAGLGTSKYFPGLTCVVNHCDTHPAKLPGLELEENPQTHWSWVTELV